MTTACLGAPLSGSKAYHGLPLPVGPSRRWYPSGNRRFLIDTSINGANRLGSVSAPPYHIGLPSVLRLPFAVSTLGIQMSWSGQFLLRNLQQNDLLAVGRVLRSRDLFSMMRSVCGLVSVVCPSVYLKDELLRSLGQQSWSRITQYCASIYFRSPLGGCVDRNVPRLLLLEEFYESSKIRKIGQAQNAKQPAFSTRQSLFSGPVHLSKSWRPGAHRCASSSGLAFAVPLQAHWERTLWLGVSLNARRVLQVKHYSM